MLTVNSERAGKQGLKRNANKDDPKIRRQENW